MSSNSQGKRTTEEFVYFAQIVERPFPLGSFFRRSQGNRKDVTKGIINIIEDYIGKHISFNIIQSIGLQYHTIYTMVEIEMFFLSYIFNFRFCRYDTKLM